MEKSLSQASLSSTQNFDHINADNSSCLPHSGWKSYRNFTETKGKNGIYRIDKTLQALR